MSAAARATGPAATTARVLRAAEGEAARRAARDSLAGVLRNEALRVLLMNGVPAQAREDLAQAVTLSVLGRIVEGAVEPGLEDGYLSVAAKNRARDWHRETSGVYEKTEEYADDFFPSHGLDPHAALEQAEGEIDIERLAARVRDLLETAPERYRAILVAVYLEGTPIDVLVEQELFREWSLTAVDDPIVTRKRARARVDKVLQRARDWVRARLVTIQEPVDPASPRAPR